MTYQPTMFDTQIPMISPTVHTYEAPRQKQIDAAFENADADFIERYTRFIRSYAAIYDDFIAGDVTTAFEQKHFKLSPRQKKSLGGLFQRLLKSGEIVATGGYRKRDQGNPSSVYRKG